MKIMTDRVEKVVPGGLFHTHKVKYSPETEKFIRELIRESKLSIFQRRKVEESVRKGDPLPLPPSKTARGLSQQKKQADIVVKKILPRRRKKDDILQSGAYERERFTPRYEKANHDVEKRKLQEIMAFGRTLKSGKMRKGEQSLKFDEEKIENLTLKRTELDDIADGIEERKQFLAKMESVGKGKEYREIINQEIQDKLLLAHNIFNKMEKLKVNS